jgi:hypothetical protein
MQALFKIVEDPHPPIPANFSDDVKGILVWMKNNMKEE